ncbi:MAG TPA: cytochrome c3 family protein, partial [Gammaproteobacteria bacterium]
HFGNDCATCHRKPFVKVENEVCIDCHRDTTAHTHMDRMPANMILAENGRCGHCHKEHNGTLSLKPEHQNLCAGCHGMLDQQPGVQTLLMNVADFGVDHPQFQPTVFTEDEWLRVSLDHPQLRHETGLKFSHAAHLTGEGVDSPQGKRVLECANCHRPEPGGAYMLPVNMERDCQECHQLNFDPAVPERTLPHGDLPELLLFLNEFYALQALQGGYVSEDAPSSIKRRRRPDERVSGREQQDALQWAQSKALKITSEVVETRICATCHTVTPVSDDKVGWHINPVHQPRHWLPLGRFNHASHDNRACIDCHDAGASENSNDVLMPGIENCRECHGGARAEDKYASTCIVCHQFHLEDKPAYGRQTPANSNEPAHE